MPTVDDLCVHAYLRVFKRDVLCWVNLSLFWMQQYCYWNRQLSIHMSFCFAFFFFLLDFKNNNYTIFV